MSMPRCPLLALLLALFLHGCGAPAGTLKDQCDAFASMDVITHHHHDTDTPGPIDGMCWNRCSPETVANKAVPYAFVEEAHCTDGKPNNAWVEACKAYSSTYAEAFVSNGLPHGAKTKDSAGPRGEFMSPCEKYDKCMVHKRSPTEKPPAGFTFGTCSEAECKALAKADWERQCAAAPRVMPQCEEDQRVALVGHCKACRQALPTNHFVGKNPERENAELVEAAILQTCIYDRQAEPRPVAGQSSGLADAGPPKAVQEADGTTVLLQINAEGRGKKALRSRKEE